MTTFNDTVRIFGDELDETDPYIDAEIVGYSLDQKVRLVEQTDRNPREWTIPAQNLKTLRDKDLLISHSEMPDPDHEIWSILGNLQDVASDDALGAAEYKLKSMAKDVFGESTKAQRGRGRGPPDHANGNN